MIIPGNADPEGQGYCQAGFSLDFYKVNSFGLIASKIYFICLIFFFYPLPLIPTSIYPLITATIKGTFRYIAKPVLAISLNFFVCNNLCIIIICIIIIYACDNLLIEKKYTG